MWFNDSMLPPDSHRGVIRGVAGVWACVKNLLKLHRKNLEPIKSSSAKELRILFPERVRMEKAVEEDKIER